MSHKYMWWTTNHMAKIWQSYKQQKRFYNIESRSVLLADESSQPNYHTYVPIDTQR